MKGYWREVEETSKVLSSNGWLRTGDLGYLDRAGQLWLIGRAKDMIKSGGENVYAAEVESVLSQHPAVEVAAVLGLPDEWLGEKVVAVLTLKPTSAAWTGSVVSLTAPTSSRKLMKHILKQALLESNQYNEDPHNLSQHSHRNQGLPKSTLIHSKL
ncbi:hypothetical protein CEUSTIGMA_g9599.t1 [Chlamydomonas eustigma]|uniref:AMP-binding enzyme C-terminal domain-containing protein n=1 Tax=Chlamydomonas eustigma TaxID=1157962 RepID=A0A250XGG4_9CHLO|nr:hypothetical protein CEUSTIGMA_g9599.t1 [Chlamydomonas eustigma]|eukprot:GAX82171.1 hypothetical protein CEUSTIGMA_g9599.t1 [Chlamydomonas eustigma]